MEFADPFWITKFAAYAGKWRFGLGCAGHEAERGDEPQARTRPNDPALIRWRLVLGALSSPHASQRTRAYSPDTCCGRVRRPDRLPIWKRCSGSRSTFAHQTAEFPIWKHCSGSRSTFAHQLKRRHFHTHTRCCRISHREGACGSSAIGHIEPRNPLELPG